MEMSGRKQYVDLYLNSAAAGHTEKVQMCLKVIRDVNLCNEKGWTALMFAARNGHVDIVKLLLDHRCDVNIMNNIGQTAADIATFWNHNHIVSLLKDSDHAVDGKAFLNFPSSQKAVYTSDDILDRASDKRKDKQWLEEQMMNKKTQFIIFVGLKPMAIPLQGGNSQTNNGVILKLVTINSDRILDILRGKPLVIFLGLEKGVISQETDNRAWFAIGLDSLSNEKQEHIEPGSIVVDMFPTFINLPKKEARIFSQAQLIAWHDRYQFCPTCGARTTVEDAGYKRTCLNADCRSNKGTHNTCYPRIDPSVIVAVVSPDGRQLLLARANTFPQLMYSCLSGYMEPGECYEDTVRREVYEECSLTVSYIQYYGNKHWCGPSILLIGCLAYVTDTDLKIDPEELSDARWFNRKDVLKMISHNHPLGLFCPPEQTLSYQLIRSWLTAISKL